VSGGLVWFDLGEESLQLLLLLPLLRREGKQRRAAEKLPIVESWWYFCREAPQVLTRLQPSPPAAEAGSARPSDLQDDQFAQDCDRRVWKERM
jgi:hypothetical protein